jgi:hypothetical protein
MLREMNVVSASAPKRSIENPRPSSVDYSARTQQRKAPTKIRKRPTRNKKSTAKRQIGTRGRKMYTVYETDVVKVVRDPKTEKR